jgi:hypothetical protein
MNSRQNAAAQRQVCIGRAALDDEILGERGSPIRLKELALPRK